MECFILDKASSCHLHWCKCTLNTSDSNCVLLTLILADNKSSGLSPPLRKTILLALFFKESVQPLVLETINDSRLSAKSLLLPEVAAVLVGFDGNFQYWNLLLASSYLADEEVGLCIYGSSDSPPKVLFVATNTDENFLRAGLIIPGSSLIRLDLECCVKKRKK